MTNRLAPNPELSLPEQLQASRAIGFIDSQQFPWLDNQEPRQLQVAELDYPDGTIYAVNAGTEKMNQITEKISQNDHFTSPDGRYSRLDVMFLQACHLEAAGLSSTSRAIKLVRGVDNEGFQDFTIKSWGEGQTPNARRLYFATTKAGRFPIKPANGVKQQEINPDAGLLIRFGYTDKRHQVKFLSLLTGRSHKNLRKGNAGSV